MDLAVLMMANSHYVSIIDLVVGFEQLLDFRINRTVMKEFYYSEFHV